VPPGELVEGVQLAPPDNPFARLMGKQGSYDINRCANSAEDGQRHLLREHHLLLLLLESGLEYHSKITYVRVLCCSCRGCAHVVSTQGVVHASMLHGAFLNDKCDRCICPACLLTFLPCQV
jgi:hypothetical protein